MMTKAVKTDAAGDDCGKACGVPERLNAAFGLLQEKWALSIVYTLMSGAIGFNEVGRGAGSVNATTLAQRLSQLERSGLVRKTVHSTMPPRTSYELTEAGAALRPVIEALAAWAERYGGGCPGAEGKGRRAAG
jgi:DNA-binding HxlR family transcriptional regulator